MEKRVKKNKLNYKSNLCLIKVVDLSDYFSSWGGEGKACIIFALMLKSGKSKFMINQDYSWLIVRLIMKMNHDYSR